MPAGLTAVWTWKNTRYSGIMESGADHRDSAEITFLFGRIEATAVVGRPTTFDDWQNGKLKVKCDFNSYQDTVQRCFMVYENAFFFTRRIYSVSSEKHSRFISRKLLLLPLKHTCVFVA